MLSTVSPSHISSNNGSNCLDEGSGANGSVARMVTCVNNLHQKWIYSQVDFTLINAFSGRCLDADTGTINQDGTKVTVWNCWGGDNRSGSSTTAREVMSLTPMQHGAPPPSRR